MILAHYHADLPGKPPAFPFNSSAIENHDRKTTIVRRESRGENTDGYG